MSMPIVIKGIIKGNTIELPGRTGLPDGYEVTLHLILTSDERLELLVRRLEGHDSRRGRGV